MLPEWLEATRSMWQIRRPYTYSPEFMQYYDSMVRLHFSAWPDKMEEFYQYSRANASAGRVGETPARDWMRSENLKTGFDKSSIM